MYYFILSFINYFINNFFIFNINIKNIFLNFFYSDYIIIILIKKEKIILFKIFH